MFQISNSIVIKYVITQTDVQAGSLTSEIVIARYNEDLHWLNTIQDIDLITIYNKGPLIDTSYINHKNVVVHNIPNVGRCDHTYLYHWLK